MSAKVRIPHQKRTKREVRKAMYGCGFRLGYRASYKKVGSVYVILILLGMLVKFPGLEFPISCEEG